MNRLTFGLLATFAAILLGSGLLAYVLRDRSAPPGTNVAAERPDNPESTPGVAATTHTGTEKQSKGGSHPLLWELFGPDASGLSPASYAAWKTTASRIALRFSLAAFLAALLAFRPRRGVPFSRRNPFVAQTQLKLNASYPLPYDFVVSGILLNLSGPAVTASYSAPNAQIAPSLGRNLAACPTPTGACTATVVVPVLEPYTRFEDRLTQLDARVTKILKG